MGVKYINFDSDASTDNKLLAKFIPLDRAFESLDIQKLWYANPEVWIDPFEKYFLNNSFGDHDCILKDRVVASCFTTKGRSEAQWKAYSEKDLALMATLTANEYINHIYDSVKGSAKVYVGKVKYVATGQIKKLNSWEALGVSREEAKRFTEEELCIRLMLLKRMPYVYENEIRIFIVFEDKLSEANKNGLYIDNSFRKDDIKSLTISPFTGKTTKEILRKYLKELGYSVSVHKLYDNVINQVIALPY